MNRIEEHVRDHNEAHSECSPSQLASNMLCPGRRRMLKQAPKQGSNKYAEEGTMLHNCIEYMIHKDFFKEPITEPEGYDILDREQEIALEDCYEYFLSVVAEIEETNEIIGYGFEVPTSLAWAGIDEVSGHVDVKISSRPKFSSGRITRLDIIDWKFGQGIFVPFEKNAQTRAYAAGSFMDAKTLDECPDVYMHICQPRLNHMGAERMSGYELARWVIHEVAPKVQATRAADAPCVPGEKQCRWCVGPTCRARFTAANDLASKVFADYVPGKLGDFVSKEELIPLYEQAKILDAFIKDVAKELFNECYNKPEGLPGYKVVEGRANRKWKDEAQAEEFLITLTDNSEYDIDFEDLYKSKLVTVAQAEKLAKGLKKEGEFKKLWEKPAGKLTLAPESDPREPVKNDAESVFVKFVGTD